MIRFSRMKLCLPALVFLLTLSAALPAADKRPNILFIFTDDHAPHAIGAYGSKINKTPNMDKLAREGMIFHNSFCTNSICGPSRAVILTGKHSHLNGFMTNGNTFDGTLRSTVVVDAQGNISHAEYGVDAQGHVARLRDTLGV